MTFQAFRGPSGAQIASMILLVTSNSDTVTQCTAHDRGNANARFQVNWTTLRCTTGPVLNSCILNISALPCFEKLKPYLGGLAIFHTPSHTEDVWKIAKPPKNGFSFSKQGSSKIIFFSRFWIFFSWVYPEKFSIDFLP